MQCRRRSAINCTRIGPQGRRHDPYTRGRQLGSRPNRSPLFSPRASGRRPRLVKKRKLWTFGGSRAGRRTRDIIALTVAKSEVYKPWYRSAYGSGHFWPLKDGFLASFYVIVWGARSSLSGTLVTSHAIRFRSSVFSLAGPLIGLRTEGLNIAQEFEEVSRWNILAGIS